MFYESELKLVKSTFQKCRIQVIQLSPDEPIPIATDIGLLKLLGFKEEAFKTFNQIVPELEDNVIYRLTDKFLRSYIFLSLPNIASRQILLIGPYLTEEISSNQILEKAEEIGIAAHNIKELERYYSGIPILKQDSHLFALLDSFAELIWHGTDTYSVIDVDSDIFENISQINLEKTILEPEKIAWDMQIMEERYNFENEIMRAVSNGQSHKIDILFSGFTRQSFEQRLSDPVRNLKNYSIIMNTLIRKAAENGGVHPIHLDKISSNFAVRIELVSSVSAVQSLMSEMFRSYCRLVRKNSIKQYSPPIQKIITTIDSDLTANLSLNALAALHNLNASYLSSLFKKETGKTITEYVNLKRIENAKRLLKTTNLQIQTVAQYCGILDIRYFSKLFKKHCGISPSEYRERN